MTQANTRRHFPRTALLAVPLAIGLAWVSSAGASSFQLAEQNGAGLGNAYAGGGAVAADASTIFFNPAGMTYLPGTHSIAVAAVVLHRKLDFSDSGSTRVNPLVPLGSNGGDAGGTSVIPAGYWSFAATPALRLGIGVSAPFGNITEWDGDFIGRYQGTKSDIKVININPSLAWRVNDRFSIGVGANHLRLDAELQSKAPVVAVLPTGPRYLGDANIKLEGDDSDWTYNLGVLWQVSPTMRVGLTYRSETKLHLPASLQVSSDFAAATSQDTNVSIKLPDTWSISVFQTIDDRWEMMGDLTRTGWQVLPALTVISKAGATLSNEALNYKDTWRIGIGANYKHSDNCKLRFGIAYDKTPVPDDESRVVRLPDTDRTWLSVGANWKLSAMSSVDVGYSHIFFKDGNINRRTTISGNPTAQFVVGKFETTANLLSVQYNASF